MPRTIAADDYDVLTGPSTPPIPKAAKRQVQHVHA